MRGQHGRIIPTRLDHCHVSPRDVGWVTEASAEGTAELQTLKKEVGLNAFSSKL